MIEFMGCGACNCGKTELYKVRDEVWVQASTNESNPCACLSCLESALGRKLEPVDFDLHFPWWKTQRPDYYSGFQDGLFGHYNPKQKVEPVMYDKGRQLGNRFFRNPHDPNTSD